MDREEDDENHTAKPDPGSQPLSSLRFGVSDTKSIALKERMRQLDIREQDLQENFIRGSGKGGQKINKTSSCVQLTHLPSGTQVRCQAGRSLIMNRFEARRLLCDAIEKKQTGKIEKAVQEREKMRRQKRKRSRRAKNKMLDDKAHQAKKKAVRKKPSSHD